MWYAVIEFGGMLFWLIMGMIVMIEFLCVLNEETGWSFGMAAITAAMVGLFTTFDTKMFLATGWKSALLWVAAYIVVGVVWALARWLLHAARRRAFFYEMKRKWLDENAELCLNNLAFSDWQDTQKSDFLNWFASQWNDADEKMVRLYSRIQSASSWHTGGEGQRGGYRCTSSEMSKMVFDAIVPKAKREKSRITLWLSFWPFSILCYVLEDMVIDFWRWLVRVVSGIMHGINRIVFAGVKKELGA